MQETLTFPNWIQSPEANDPDADIAANWFLMAIKAAEEKAAKERQAFDQLMKTFAPYQAMLQADSTLNMLKAKAREYFEKQEPHVYTPGTGKMGFQVRRTFTFKPAAVRELAPRIADLCIVETVDSTALKSYVKNEVKLGHAPEDLLEQLQAKADVKESKAFICEIAKEPTTEAVAAEAAKG